MDLITFPNTQPEGSSFILLGDTMIQSNGKFAFAVKKKIAKLFHQITDEGYQAQHAIVTSRNLSIKYEEASLWALLKRILPSVFRRILCIHRKKCRVW